MVDVLLICGGFIGGWALAGWIARAETTRRERIWRSRHLAHYPATRSLTLTFTDDATDKRYVEAAEVNTN